jgi:hypothetical protein
MNKQFIDNRGSIEELIQETFTVDGVVYIYSNAGSRRADHYHKYSSHWCILSSGLVSYYERPVGSNEKPTLRRFEPNQPFFTAPMMEHTMIFEKDSEMLCLRVGGSKNQDDYENDLVRIDIKLDEL